MKAAAIGRQAEMGEGWDPPGVVCRKKAELICKSMSSPQIKTDFGSFTQWAPPACPSSTTSSPPSRDGRIDGVIQKVAGSKTDWGSMVPTSRPSTTGREDWAPVDDDKSMMSSCTQLWNLRQKNKCFPPSGDQGATATGHWNMREASLARDSFNCIYKRTKCDSSEVLMRNTNLSKFALMGPGWQPSGIVTRRIAEMATTRRPDPV